MRERPLEDLAVDVVHPLDEALDAVHEAAHPRARACSAMPGGSRHTADSIGSSVKLTNSDTMHRDRHGHAELEEEACR